MIAQNSALILSVASFVVVIMLYVGIVSLITAGNRHRQLVEKTAKWSGSTAVFDENMTNSPESPRRQFSKFPVGLFGRSKERGEGGIYANTPLFYQRAGIYNSSAIRFYQALRYSLLLAPFSYPLFTYAVLAQPVSRLTLMLAFVVGCLGYYLPLLWLRFIARARKKELNRSFPDALDLLMVCIEAGLGIDAAIRRVALEIHITSPELGKELKILSLELKTGMSRNRCLRNLARRTDLPEIDNLVSLLIQAEKYGTGVANALRIHAEEMRQRRYSKLEEMAAKLPVKLVLPLILFIFPALFVVIAGPAAIQVLRVIIQG